MFKRLFFVVAALSFAYRASAETLFDGMLTFTAFSNCPSGLAAGISPTVSAQYHPYAVSGVSQVDTEAELNLAFINPLNLTGFRTPGADFPISASGVFVTPSPIVAYGVAWGPWTPSATAENVVITSRAPATVSNTTPYVFLRGKIQNPYFNSLTPNCVGTFEFLGLLSKQG